MATTPFNSMPQNVTYGARDKSIPDPIPTVKQYPTHMPLWLLFMEKGPTHRVAADSVTREQLYGTASFTEGSKYFTHATQYSNTVSSRGNQGVYQRLLDETASQAMMRIWLDVLPTSVPLYERGTDGKYLLDQAGRPKPTGETTPGIILKFVKTPIDDLNGGPIGQASQMVGDQTNAAGIQSMRYPWLDVPASFKGKYGADLGLRIWAPTAGSRVAVDNELLEDNKAYPYVISCIDRSTDTIQSIQTTAGTHEITCVFKRDQVKASVNRQQISFDPRFYNMYNDRDRVGLAPLYGPFERSHVYHENLETVLFQIYDTEQIFIDQYSDFEGTGEDEIHRVNFLGGKSSKGVPYHSFLVNRSDDNAEPMSDISTLWQEGGSDGKTDLDTFNRLVAAEMRKYADINENVTENRLGNPESHFYDSGFDAETKMVLANFIAVRKDTNVVWCLKDAQQARPMTADEESSMAIALFTRVSMMPESSEYATPAMRALICACDGRYLASNNSARYPLSLEIASKAAEYMGAGNGLWKSEFSFSNGPRANVSMFAEVNVPFRPIAARQRDWANGMVYVQSKDMDTLYFPALRSVYSVQNSTLTSWFTTQIFSDLQKVADRVHAQFSGTDKYSNEQFKKYVELECRRQVEGKYDSRANIVFTVNFTAVDEYNGYSYTLDVDVGTDVMKTVQFTVITGYRRESMPSVN